MVVFMIKMDESMVEKMKDLDQSNEYAAILKMIASVPETSPTPTVTAISSSGLAFDVIRVC